MMPVKLKQQQKRSLLVLLAVTILAVIHLVSQGDSLQNVVLVLFHTSTTTTTSSRSLTTTTTEPPPPTTSSSSSSSLLPLCTRKQVREGRWVAVRYQEPPYLSKTLHLQCHPPALYKNQSFYDSFEWLPYDAVDPYNGALSPQQQPPPITTTATGTTTTTRQQQQLEQNDEQASSSSSPCLMTTWNATDFCRVTKRTTISIIGDSLSWEMYSSLLQLLGRRVHQSDQHKSKQLNQNHVQYACQQQNEQLLSSSSDSHTRIIFRNDPRLEQVADSLKHHFPVILILNRGAHYSTDTELIESLETTVLPVIRDWFHACYHQLLIDCHFLWRTTVPGHPQCQPSIETQPVNDRHAMEARIGNISLYLNDTILPLSNTNTTTTTAKEETFAIPRLSYHWYDFQRQNQLVVSLLEDFQKEIQATYYNNKNNENNNTSVPSLTISFLDAYELMILRPDGHRQGTSTSRNNSTYATLPPPDCLHNCYPGKMDTYNQLLLHILKDVRTPEILQKFDQQYQQALLKQQAQKTKTKQQQEQHHIDVASVTPEIIITNNNTREGMVTTTADSNRSVEEQQKQQ